MATRSSSADSLQILLPRPHSEQEKIILSPAKRKVVRAGRRGGKTVGLAILAVLSFLKGIRVLYATPTADQIDMFWRTVTRALEPALDRNIFYKNETRKIIELSGTEQRLRAKTAYNASTLRGDYADLLILDEYQLMAEDTWGEVGAPMLLDNNGDAVFIYTPPSLASRSASKAVDKMHAMKLFRRAQADTTGRWETFHFASRDNPHISDEALEEIVQDMTSVAYRQEILALDIDEAPGALWTRAILEDSRTLSAPDLPRVVVGLDPSATSTGDEAGIVTAGSRNRHFYCIEDASIQGSPDEWARAAIAQYHKHSADCIVAEKNNGGEMVSKVLNTVDPDVPVKLVWASRGKETRAEPISAIYEQGRGHQVGAYPELEDELCMWTPGDESPNRLDALVWAGTYLMLGKKRRKPPPKSHSS